MLVIHILCVGVLLICVVGIGSSCCYIWEEKAHVFFISILDITFKTYEKIFILGFIVKVRCFFNELVFLFINLKKDYYG